MSLLCIIKGTTELYYQHMDYSAFTVEDFISDPYFRKWVETPDPRCHQFWQEFMQQHPEKIGQLEEAREILLFLSFDVIQPAMQDQREVKAAIFQKIKHSGLQGPLQRTAKSRGRKLWTNKVLARAAVFAGILVCALGAYVSYTLYGPTTITTQYGQTRIVDLPDGSVVTLNANTSIRFNSDWTQSHLREVWLSGEAFFDIRKKPGWRNAKFVVHTGELQVEVLGTTFNVNNRRGNVQVVLNTGKVKLQPVNNQADTLTMQPRDLVEFKAAQKAFVKKVVNPEEHTSWRNHKLVFNETPLVEIAQVLEDTYGLDIRFEKPELKNRRFTGAIPNQDMDLLLSVLSQSMHIEMKKNNQSILVKSIE